MNGLESSEPLVANRAEWGSHPAIQEVRAKVRELSSLRAKIRVLDWSVEAKDQATQVEKGLEQALALYAAIPGSSAMRFVEHWTNAALLLLARHGSAATLRL